MSLTEFSNPAHFLSLPPWLSLYVKRPNSLTEVIKSLIPCNMPKILRFVSALASSTIKLQTMSLYDATY